jgi:acetolactate synthase-1/2/3 large subunit
MTIVPPGSSSTIALGMGGMGYAIAGAIGAQLGSPPGTRTVVFAGDGAFLMTGLEIHTAVDLGLPILFVVFNNNMHGMCVTRQQLFFESRLECVRYAPVNVELIARGLGTPDQLWVGSASTVDELRYQLEDYRKHTDLPGVLELRLLHEEVPPFTPFLPEYFPTIPIGYKEESKGISCTKLQSNFPESSLVLVSSPH